MTERGMIFNAEMVRAVLDGSKTQTRRIIKLDHERGMQNPVVRGKNGEISYVGCRLASMLCPFGQPGDRLWVRETFMNLKGTGIESTTGQFEGFAYRADTPPGSYGDIARKDYGLKWTPSIHMPRRASHITLEITGVRVERLQDISEADAKAEGLAEITKDGSLFKFGIPDRDGYPGTDDNGWPWAEWERNPVDAFCKLWQSIYGADSWQANPWVWVIEFKRVEGE